MSSRLVTLHSRSIETQPVNKEKRRRANLILGLLVVVGLIIWTDTPKSAVESASATAIEQMKPPKVNTPSLVTYEMMAALGKVCEKELGAFEFDLRESAEEHMLDPLLLVAIMQVESNCRAEAKSERGAIGLMQVIPSTALSVGIKDVAIPSQNIQAAAKYIRLLQTDLGENLDVILAAYHAGPTAIRVHRGVPPYKATKEYVSRVRNIYSKLRGTPAALS